MTSKVPAAELVTCAEFLAERGVYGGVWFSDDLIVTQRIGPLVDDIPIGVPVTRSVLPLLGYDEEIRALRHGKHDSIIIPNVRLAPGNTKSPRINLVVYWLPSEERYILFLSITPSSYELEVTLTAQVRARAIAEADATAKSRLIARANEELTRANQDLEAFASVISHDLRSPLRRLRSFANAAASAVGEGRKESALAGIDEVLEQARRMASMLNGLLEYSRIGRKDEAVEDVDTQALVEEIIASIEHPASLEIVVEGGWPLLASVRQPIDIVLRNLIDNAVRHHDRCSGTIRVASEAITDSWVFSVTDDGPGIAAEWHQAIFEPFKRISEDDGMAEGPGMGLALVKRIVDHIGGRIEVGSDPSRGRGATFRVHWPRTIATAPAPTDAQVQAREPRR